MNRALVGTRSEAVSLAATQLNTAVGLLSTVVTLSGVAVTVAPGALQPAATAATSVVPPLVRVLIVVVSLVMTGHVHVSAMGWIRMNATRYPRESTSASIALCTLSGGLWAWAAFATARVFLPGGGWLILATLLLASGLVLRMLTAEHHERALLPQAVVFIIVFGFCWAVV